MSYASLRNVEKLLLLFLGANRAFNYFVHLPYRGPSKMTYVYYSIRVK